MKPHLKLQWIKKVEVCAMQMLKIVGKDKLKIKTVIVMTHDKNVIITSTSPESSQNCPICCYGHQEGSSQKWRTTQHPYLQGNTQLGHPLANSIITWGD